MVTIKNKCFNNLMSTIFLVCLVICVFILCTHHDPISNPPTIEDWKLNENELFECDAFRDLLSFRTELVQRVTNRNIPKEIFRAAFESGDEIQFCTLLGYTIPETQKLKMRLSNNIKSIIDSFPELVNFTKEHSNTWCNSCPMEEKIDRFFDNYELIFSQSIQKENVSNQKQNISNEAPGCKWLPYTACLVGCGLAAPAIPVYLVCSYVCFCGFCPDHDAYEILCDPF
jgi:hypothetical protein